MSNLWLDANHIKHTWYLSQFLLCSKIKLWIEWTIWFGIGARLVAGLVTGQLVAGYWSLLAGLGEFAAWFQSQTGHLTHRFPSVWVDCGIHGCYLPCNTDSGTEQGQKYRNRVCLKIQAYHVVIIILFPAQRFKSVRSYCCVRASRWRRRQPEVRASNLAFRFLSRMFRFSTALSHRMWVGTGPETM